MMMAAGERPQQSKAEQQPSNRRASDPHPQTETPTNGGCIFIVHIRSMGSMVGMPRQGAPSKLG
jgi:hypothetical protein